MTIRQHIVGDLARHLSDEVVQVIQRHILLATGGGVQQVEIASVMMILSEAVATQAIGTVAICAEQPDRPAIVRDLIAELARKLTGSRDFILATVQDADVGVRS